MGQATMTTVDAILKEIYGPRIENQLQNETTALKRIERTSDGVVETVGGKYVDFPIKVSRNTGIGYRSENEVLPAAGQQGYAEVHVPLKYGYGRGKITAQVMKLAETNAQAFSSGLDNEMDGLKDDLLKDSNRTVYGDGSGLLCSIVSDNPDGDNSIEVDNIQWLEIGMRIDIRTRASGAAIGLDRLITEIDETNLYVYYDGADVDPTNADGLYREGNYASGTSREVSGFGIIVSDTGELHNVDPATQPKWAATVLTNPAAAGTPRALSEGLMIQTADGVRRKGGKTSLILGGLGVRRSYFNLLTQQRRYTDTKEFAGGFQGLAFNYGTEIPMVEDVDSPPNQMLFLDEKKIKVYRNQEWHFADEEGHTLKWVTNYDAYEFLMRQYWELGTSQRNAHALLADLIEG